VDLIQQIGHLNKQLKAVGLFFLSLQLTVGSKHNRSGMVAVLGPFEALPCYIHTTVGSPFDPTAFIIFLFKILLFMPIINII
jgi:hypothetical protein